MLTAYTLALAAAFSWSLASLISVDITRVIGEISFNRIRLIVVTIMLLIFTILNDGFTSIENEFLFPIIISGFIGIFLGDTLLFSALKTIGPRRNNILFSLAAPFTVFFNIWTFA